MANEDQFTELFFGGNKEANKGAEFIVDLYKKGLNNSPETLGYHGTSLETLEFILKFGKLPGFSGESGSPEQPQTGDIYFFPVKTKQQYPGAPEDPQKSSATYALLIARAHCFLRTLDLDLSDPKVYEIACALTDDLKMDESDINPLFSLKKQVEDSHKAIITDAGLKLENLKNEFGLSDEKINFAIRRSFKRKGIVVSLSSRIADLYEITAGDKQAGDARIKVNGLNPTFLNGIEAEGEVERLFFEQLGRSLPKH